MIIESNNTEANNFAETHEAIGGKVCPVCGQGTLRWIVYDPVPIADKVVAKLCECDNQDCGVRYRVRYRVLYEHVRSDMIVKELIPVQEWIHKHKGRVCPVCGDVRQHRLQNIGESNGGIELLQEGWCQNPNCNTKYTVFYELSGYDLNDN